MHVMDCSCASIFWFFSAASDGATADRQIPNHIFGHFFTSLRKIASPMHRFGLCFNRLLEEMCFTKLQGTKRLVVISVGGATIIANLR